jgi:hypothetical protein
VYQLTVVLHTQIINHHTYEYQKMLTTAMTGFHGYKTHLLWV